MLKRHIATLLQWNKWIPANVDIALQCAVFAVLKHGSLYTFAKGFSAYIHYLFSQFPATLTAFVCVLCKIRVLHELL